MFQREKNVRNTVIQAKTWEFLAMRNVKCKCNDLCNMRALVTVKSTNTCRKWSSHSHNNYETSGTQVKATRNIIIRIRASQLDIGTCIIRYVYAYTRILFNGVVLNTKVLALH